MKWKHTTNFAFVVAADALDLCSSHNRNNMSTEAYYDYGLKYDTLSHNTLRFIFIVSAGKVEVTMSYPKIPYLPLNIDPC